MEHWPEKAAVGGPHEDGLGLEEEEDRSAGMLFREKNQILMVWSVISVAKMPPPAVLKP